MILNSVVHVLGLGSIGSYVAFSLKEAYPHLKVVAITSSIDFRGIIHFRKSSDQQRRSVQLDIDDGGTISNLIITCKVQDLQKSLTKVSSRFDKEAEIISLCNGMYDAPLQCKKGIITTGVYQDRSGDSNTLHQRDIIQPGENGMIITPHSRLSALLRSGGRLNWQWKDTNEVDNYIIRKFATNCTSNALGAISRKPNKYLFENDEWKEVIDEVCDVLYAKGLIQDKLEIKSYAEKVIRAAGENYNSMLQDVLRQQKTEIDYLNGWIVQSARSTGIKVSANERVVDLVHNIESSYTNT